MTIHFDIGFSVDGLVSWPGQTGEVLLGGVAWNETPTDYQDKMIYIYSDKEITMKLPTLMHPSLFESPEYTHELSLVSDADSDDRIEEDELDVSFSDGFQVTFNQNGSPTYTDRAVIGNYYFIHNVLNELGFHVAGKAWMVQIRDSCTPSLI